MGVSLTGEHEKKNWKHVTAVLLGAVFILLFALWFNRERGFYGPAYADDFKLWNICMERTLFEMVCTDRPITNAASWLLFHLCGTDYTLYDWVLRSLLVAIAVQAYYVAMRISKSVLLGIGVGICTVVTQFSDYIRTQAFGVMEGLAHLFAVFVLYELFCVLNETEFSWKRWIGAGIFFFLAILTHERYMFLGASFVFVFLFRFWKNGRPYFRTLIVPGVVLGLGVGWRLLQMGSSFLSAQGSDVRDTFDLVGFFERVWSAILYLLGVNTGKHWFCWTNWEQMPLVAQNLSFITLFAALLLVVLGSVLAFATQKGCTQKIVCNILFLVLYIGALVAISSSATRVELRWLYVPYVAALILIVYVLREGISGSFEKIKNCGVQLVAGVLFLFYLAPYLSLQTYYTESYWQNYYYVEWNDSKYVYTQLIENQNEKDIWNKEEIWLVDRRLKKALPEEYLVVYDPNLKDGVPRLHLVRNLSEIPETVDEQNSLVVYRQKRHCEQNFRLQPTQNDKVRSLL